MVLLLRSLLTVALLASASPAIAAQAVAVSVEELARSSHAVVRGKVAKLTSQFSEDGRRIFTTVELRRRAALRGEAPARVRVIVPGGVVGDTGQRVDAAPRFKRGEDVVVFLERAGPAGYRVTGLAQGKFTVEGRTARPDVSELTFVRTSVGAGERRVEEMSLAELERRVRSTR